MLFIWHVIKVGYMINNYKERKEWSGDQWERENEAELGKKKNMVVSLDAIIVTV